MTNEEFREGFAAGKRKALVIPQRGYGWNIEGKMDYLCDTVVTLPDRYKDFGIDGVLVLIDRWYLSDGDFVRFVEENEDEQH